MACWMLWRTCATCAPALAGSTLWISSQPDHHLPVLGGCGRHVALFHLEQSLNQSGRQTAGFTAGPGQGRGNAGNGTRNGADTS